MNMKDFKDSLDYLFKAQLTPFVWGHAGVGKTESVKQYAKDKGYKFFAFYLGTQSDSGDILGLYEFVRDANGNATSVTYAIPHWIKETIDYCHQNPNSGAVIFLDEFNRARRDILNGMFAFALDKKFHTIQLPTNCHIIAAGNPPTDEYVTTDIDETALMARFAHINLEPSFDEWKQFAKGNEVNSDLLGFLSQQPELLTDSRASFNLPVKVDRRAWSRVDRLYKVNTPKHLLTQLMGGIVGFERVVAFEEYMKNNEIRPLTSVELLSGEHLDKIKEWCNPESITMSMLNLTMDNMKSYMIENKPVLSETEKANLMKVIEIIPRDLMFSFLHALANERNDNIKTFILDPKYEKVLLGYILDVKKSK